MSSHEYRERLSIEVTQNLEAQRFSVGNTGFWVTLRKVPDFESPAWILNYTPENNRDSNIVENRKILYRNLFLVALDAFWKKQVAVNGEGTYQILTAPHTNYRFFRFLQKLVLDHAPNAQLNHVVLTNANLKKDVSLEERYLKHRYSIDLSLLFASESFQALLAEAHKDISEKITQGFDLLFELED